MGEISSDNFFEAVKKEIEKDNNINKEVKELIKATDFDLKKHFENCEDINDAIPILQEINKKFITEYKIQINYNNKDLTIIPIETEIYFSKVSSEKPDDGMCHINELQKGFVEDEKGENKERFGKLYFHRKGKSKDNKILCANSKTTWGGVDVCLSDSQDYCLSILIRSALFINKIEKDELVSGTRNICNKIKEKCFDNKDSLQTFFKNLEKKEDNKEDNKVRIFKRNDYEQANIFCQPRISGKEYYRKTIEYKLNCLNLGESLTKENKEKNKYKYDYLFLNFIKQNFYTETKKQDIENNFKNKNDLRFLSYQL